MILRVGLWLLFLSTSIAVWAQEAGQAAGPEAAGAADRNLWSTLRDQGLGGSLRFDYFRSSKSLDDQTGFLGSTAQVKMLPTLNKSLDGKIEARLTNPDIGDDGDTHSRLLEGYATAHFDNADLRIGRQIVAWGRADGINPTDNLTPHDYTVMLPFEDDQRFGTTALKLDWYLSTEHTLTFFTTPFFEPSKLPLAPGVSFHDSRPTRTLGHSEAAIKFNKTGGSLDWSVSYFHGYSLLPEIRPLPAGAGLELHYPEIDVVGADMARNFGRYGMRAEVAYIQTEDNHGQDPVAINPYIYAVAGVDRTFLDNLNLNLQLVGRWVQHYSDPEAVADPALRAIAIGNATAFGQQSRTSYGMTSRLSNKWFNDTLEAELLVFVNFDRTNSYLRPLMTYAFTDHLKATFGGEFYRGPDGTFFGQLKRNQGVFSELRYSF
jgi:hypothetical protein